MSLRQSMCCIIVLAAAAGALAADGSQKGATSFPPSLPGNAGWVSDTSDAFLNPPASLKKDVAIAKTPPKVDFAYYPGQSYAGNPWSAWGDSLFANGKYYASIGDHRAVGKGGDGNGNGRALVFEVDPEKKAFRELVDVSKTLALPADHYAPGKIHGRLDMGSDGWLYFATHRGSERVTSDRNHFLGDWIMRADAATGKVEVVVQGPVEKHSIPASVLDPDRMIFYGATAPGTDAKEKGVCFFAYDLRAKKMLYSGANGPSRAMALARSTGRVYYVPGNGDGDLMRFDPKEPAGPTKVENARLGIRAATQETADGFIYAVSQGPRGGEVGIYSLNTKTEEVKQLGTAEVGGQTYIASIDVDATGRFLYYIPGAHGGSDLDGSPVVQFDVKTGKKKVIAFLAGFYREKYGIALKGTYSSAIDAKGERLFVTWHVSRGGKVWDCCGVTVLHVPEGER